MTVIERRAGRDGGVAFRVKVRLKGQPPVSATFERITDAKKWAQATEAEASSVPSEADTCRKAEPRRP